MRSLSKTCRLPTVELQRIFLRFLEEAESFPWLKLVVQLSHDRPPEWETLMNALNLGIESPIISRTLTFISQF
jgi:hypothetical protein